MQVAGLFDGTEESTIRVPAETEQDPEDIETKIAPSKIGFRVLGFRVDK